jgi:enoyl-CoA hydratase
MTELIQRDEQDGLCRLTLNRPEALNALSPALFVELRSHIDDLAQRSEAIGAVILCGAGRAFSAGNDLKAIGDGAVAPSPHFQAETIDALEALPQVVIGAIHGPCYTGALELALGCDLLIAGSSAAFCDSHGRWGMSPTWGMGSRLPRRLGVQAALETVPDETLLAHAEAKARSYLENSWFTLRADKFLVNGAQERPGQAGPQWERAVSPGRGPDMAERLKNFGKRA